MTIFSDADWEHGCVVTRDWLPDDMLLCISLGEPLRGLEQGKTYRLHKKVGLVMEIDMGKAHKPSFIYTHFIKSPHQNR